MVNKIGELKDSFRTQTTADRCFESNFFNGGGWKKHMSADFSDGIPYGIEDGRTAEKGFCPGRRQTKAMKRWAMLLPGISVCLTKRLRSILPG